MALYKRRDYDAAAAAFDRELERHPDHAPSLHYRALILLDSGNSTAALPLLQRLVAIAPGNAAGWTDLGRAALTARDATGAVAALRRAVALAPEEPSAHFLLGRALALAGRTEESRKELMRATELNRRLRKRLRDAVSGDRPR
jgi:Flp pilus assembly protein TadD